MDGDALLAAEDLSVDHGGTPVCAPVTVDVEPRPSS
jgi:hypothetical protein